ncbi:MAG: hypothetical protein IT344_05915 [Candidatus Dadabacteria bacterium]|nr:hypothetical protein [Candidatus Dadabacteria bacterium]
MLEQLKMFAGYARGLNSFLTNPMTPSECRSLLESQIASRAENFLAIMQKAVYENPKSPYLPLLRLAGVGYGDLSRMVSEDGVEGALDRLYESGVYITLDEFKRRVPIKRPGLEIETSPHDFDNPFLSRHYQSRTSGSRGAGTRVIMDLDLLHHDAACNYFMFEGFGLTDRPAALWREVPPVTTGVNILLRYAKLGKRADKWFSSSRLSTAPKSLQFTVFTYYTVLAGRLLGMPLPFPEHVPLEDAATVAKWLAGRCSAGTPAFLDTQVSTCVRTCAAAMENGLDISGTTFIIGGEPYTEAKAEVIRSSGANAASRYSMAELGNLGFPCADGLAFDDIHLMTDKVAVIQREKKLGAGEISVNGFVYTTILPHCPKIMLNVESDDYADIEERDCGCTFGELGFRTHLTNIRSYEKLTSGGVTFLGAELLRLIDEVLPGAFGGRPTDYQLSEDEEGGLTKVSILISPRVGEVNERAVIRETVSFLGRFPGGDIMSDQWVQGGTLRVVRREPYTTASAKILPLHIRKG